MYIVIVGGGLVGGELVRKLVKNKHDVVVVDQSREVCDQMYADTGVIAICGKGSDVQTLRRANLEKADVVVAATGSDSENLVCSVLAKSFDVPQIIVRMRDISYERGFRLAGVDRIVRVTDMMTNFILREIERSEVEEIQSIAGGKGRIFSVIIPKDAKISGMTVEQIAAKPDFPEHCNIMAIVDHEKEEFIIPRGHHEIKEGFELLLIASTESIKKVGDMLTERKKK